MHSASPIRRRAWVVTALLGSVLVLTACAGAPDGEPVPDPAAWGVEWVQIDAPTPMATVDGGFWSEFSAAGALWLVNSERPTTLYGTSNGRDWATVDLVDAGLPEDARLAGHQQCDVDLVLDDRGESFVPVFTTFYNGSHPDGIGEKTWLPEISTGGEVLSLVTSADNGLEAMPARERGRRFRTSCIGAFLDLPGGRMIVGAGQWWEPHRTSDRHIYSATESSGGTWSVFSTNTPPMGGDNGYPLVVAATAFDGDALMLTRPVVDDRTFSAWRSSDGRSWDVTPVEAFPEGEFSLGTPFRLLSSADGSTLVLIAGRSTDSGEVVSAWTSGDGRDWERVDFDEGPDSEVVVATVSASGFSVIFDADGEPHLWTSADGLTWVQSDAEVALRAKYATAHEGGLVVVSSDALWVSGLDWE